MLQARVPSRLSVLLERRDAVPWPLGDEGSLGEKLVESGREAAGERTLLLGLPYVRRISRSYGARAETR